MSNKTKTPATKGEASPALVPKLRFPEFREADGWAVDFLGGICAPQQWTTISSADLVDRGYPVYGANGFIGYYPEFNHEFETVAVTCRGSTCGEVTLIPPKSYITGNSMCLDGIDAVQNSYHFVYQLLKHRGFDDIISGSAQPQIVGNAIKRLRIALPKSPNNKKSPSA
jgi:type I restriction enzyme, S subunit